MPHVRDLYGYINHFWLVHHDRRMCSLLNRYQTKKLKQTLDEMENDEGLKTYSSMEDFKREVLNHED